MSDRRHPKQSPAAVVATVDAANSPSLFVISFQYLKLAKLGKEKNKVGKKSGWNRRQKRFFDLVSPNLIEEKSSLMISCRSSEKEIKKEIKKELRKNVERKGRRRKSNRMKRWSVARTYCSRSRSVSTFYLLTSMFLLVSR
jgi:acetylornithine deacetylase/succinyl-diaminopimelate desuccinylase-like protein